MQRGSTMVEKFNELKKKYAVITLLKSLIAGAFFALFVVGVVLLGVKLGAARLAWYYYLIIGLGSFAGAFGLTFLLTRYTDKSLAKHLDEEYGLNEKVQTMVEFAGQDGDVLALQREDTERTLENLPKKKITFAKIWQYVVITVLGIAFFVSGIAVPSRYVAPEVDVDDKFVLNEWDEKALEQLIADVKSSDLEEKVSVPTIAALELLKDSLGGIKTNSEMREAVKNCATSIDEAVVLANSYRDVAEAVNEFSVLDKFKSALISASKSYEGDVAISSISQVKAEQKQSEGKIRTALAVFTDSFLAKVKAAESNVEIRDTVFEIVDPINDAMADEDLMNKLAEDDLYKAIYDFSESFTVVREEYYWRDDLKTIVSSSCTNFVSAAAKELVVQVYNRMMEDMIFNSLYDIFGVKVYPSDLTLSDSSDDGVNDGDNGSQGGGLGDNNVVYGGDDAVYDPTTGTYVPYGQVWNEYVAKLYERLNDEESGLSEEMKSYINNYIGILYGNFTDSSEGAD